MVKLFLCLECLKLERWKAGKNLTFPPPLAGRSNAFCWSLAGIYFFDMGWPQQIRVCSSTHPHSWSTTTL
jgi:hypothetical protein